MTATYREECQHFWLVASIQEVCVFECRDAQTRCGMRGLGECRVGRGLSKPSGTSDPGRFGAIRLPKTVASTYNNKLPERAQQEV